MQNLKKIILKFKNKASFIAIFTRMNFIFIRSLLRSRRADKLVLFHIDSWMMSWDLERRLEVYSRIIGLDKAIMINFDSRLHCYILNAFINKHKELKNYELVSQRILSRCLWDIYIKKDDKKILLDDSKYSYLSFYKSFINKINIKKYSLICSLLSSDRIESLHLVQEAYLELWLANVARELGKTVYFSESEFGSIKTKGLSLEERIKIYLNIMKKLRKKELVAGEKSLKFRAEGNYAESYLGDYSYKDAPKDGLRLADINSSEHRYNIVLFLHAFSDSPNFAIDSVEDFSFIDHYDLFLSIIDWVAGKDDTGLFIRFHPHSKSYPADRKYIEAVKNIVQGKSNVRIVNSDFLTREILKRFDQKSLAAVTGFGSVSLEMAWNGIHCFNYKRNIYTELGVSRYLERFEDLFDSSSEDPEYLKKRAVEVEAARIRMRDASIFRFNNANFTSESNLYELMDTIR